MSHLRRGDERMHYQDGSHRWIRPDGYDQEAWEDRIREHQRQHREKLGGGNERERRIRVP